MANITLPYETDGEFFYNLVYRDYKERDSNNLYRIIRDYENSEETIRDKKNYNSESSLNLFEEFETAKYKAAKDILDERKIHSH